MEAESELIDPASIRWFANGTLLPALNGQAHAVYTVPNGSNRPIDFGAQADDPCSAGDLVASNQLSFLTGGNSCLVCRETVSGPRPAPGAALYPNPADGEVLLTPAVETTATESAHSRFQATIYDWQGRLVLDQTTDQPSLHLRTAAWQPGLYQVVLRQGPRTVRQQLSIQH